MFIMDGDFAPLLELIKLHRMYGLLLVLDVPWTVGDHCDVGVIGLTKCSGTHGLLPCFDTFLLVSIQRDNLRTSLGFHDMATIMSSAVFASMRLNATNQSYLHIRCSVEII